MWRQQLPDKEVEVPLQLDATSTLYEIGMPEEPKKTLLTIKENAEGPPQKVSVSKH